MDLTSLGLFGSVAGLAPDEFEFTLVRPPIKRRARSLLPRKMSALALNIDRLLHRFIDYPRLVRKCRHRFDLFHIQDHSHAHLIHVLGDRPAVITCHDLETFACLLTPNRQMRSLLFRVMTTHILNGFLKATRVVCVSKATRDAALASGIVRPEKTVVIRNGIQQFGRIAQHLDPAAEPAADAVELLHVGSSVARKRLDVLIRVLGNLRASGLRVYLIQVGGALTQHQRELISELAIHEYVKVLHSVPPTTLAALYKRAALVLQPSEAEGFGLPVIEALSLGTPVVASDIPALREVGGPASTYCPVGDVEAWTSVITDLLKERSENAELWQHRQERGILWASSFTWDHAAESMLSVYRQLITK